MAAYRQFIQETLSEAAEIARENFGNVSGVKKINDPNQVLTETDLAISELFIERIAEAYPGHNILDEEAGAIDKRSVFTWVLDPIDGTSNFAAGSPLYGSMIGLLYEAVPIAGGIVLPSFGELSIAEKGSGASLNGKAIRVAGEQNLADALVAYGIDGHPDDPQRTHSEAKLIGELTLRVLNIRTSNSVYDMVAVAKGMYGAYMNQTTKIWDNVAPQIIIEEAGGVYTDFTGKVLDYRDPLTRATDNFACVAAPPALHKQILEIANA